MSATLVRMVKDRGRGPQPSIHSDHVRDPLRAVWTCADCPHSLLTMRLDTPQIHRLGFRGSRARSPRSTGRDTEPATLCRAHPAWIFADKSGRTALEPERSTRRCRVGAQSAATSPTGTRAITRKCARIFRRRAPLGQARRRASGLWTAVLLGSLAADEVPGLVSGRAHGAATGFGVARQLALDGADRLGAVRSPADAVASSELGHEATAAHSTGRRRGRRPPAAAGVSRVSGVRRPARPRSGRRR